MYHYIGLTWYSNGGKLFFVFYRRQLDLYVPPKILLQSKRAAVAQVWKNKLYFCGYFIPGFHHFVPNIENKKIIDVQISLNIYIPYK